MQPEDVPLRDGPAGCLATKRAVEDGFGVYYFYRAEPCNDMDSGWIFTHGTEDDEYINDPSNSTVYHISTIAELRPEIVPHLNLPIGSAFYWDGSSFIADTLGSPDAAPIVH